MKRVITYKAEAESLRTFELSRVLRDLTELNSNAWARPTVKLANPKTTSRGGTTGEIREITIEEHVTP